MSTVGSTTVAQKSVVTQTPETTDYAERIVFGAAVGVIGMAKMWQGFMGNDFHAVGLGVGVLAVGACVFTTGIYSMPAAEKSVDNVAAANEVLTNAMENRKKKTEATEIELPFTKEEKEEIGKLLIYVKASGQLLKGDLSGSWISSKDKPLKEAIKAVQTQYEVCKIAGKTGKGKRASYEKLNELIAAVENLIAKDVALEGDANTGKPIGHGISGYTYEGKMNKFHQRLICGSLVN